MPLEDILQEVEKRKEEEIERISREYKARIDSVNSEVEQELKDLEAFYAKKIDDDSRTLKERETQLAHMEAKGLAREKVSKLMQDALGRAEFFIRNISDTKEYKEILKKMVNLSVSTLGADCIIHARKEDHSLVKGAGSVKLAGDSINSAGIVAESADGNRELDLTIDTILGDIREKVSLELIKHLGEE